MNWKIETAQQHFLEIVSAVKQNPQLIYEHNHPVAGLSNFLWQSWKGERGN